MPSSDGRRHPLALRTFDIPTSDSTNITVRITEPSLVADNLPLETWASSTILASQLCQFPISFPSSTSDLGTTTSPFDKPTATTTNGSPSINDPSITSPSAPQPQKIIPIIELGAGTGLVGITAAHIYAQPVILTDLPPIVPGLEANIALNADANDSNAVLHDRTVRAGVLDWTAPGTLHVSPRPARTTTATSPSAVPPADKANVADEELYHAVITKAHVLLAADTLYSSEHPALLTDVVRTWLSPDPEARFVLGTALRVAYLEEIRELWERLEGMGLECVAEGKGEALAEDFDDERLVEWSFWRWRQ